MILAFKTYYTGFSPTLDWLMTWQFVIGFFLGSGIVLVLWVLNILSAHAEAQRKYYDPDHKVEEAPVQGCNCSMCDAARAAKGVL